MPAPRVFPTWEDRGTITASQAKQKNKQGDILIIDQSSMQAPLLPPIYTWELKMPLELPRTTKPGNQGPLFS